MHRYIVLTLLSVILLNASSALGVISNAVMPVSYFKNSVIQLKKIKDNLDKYGVASVVGTSGIGKTQVARMYVYENRERYDLIWFFDSNLDLNKQFTKLAEVINEQKGVEISTDELRAKKEVQDYLQNKNDWILIFDNLKIGQNSKVQDMQNWDNNGHILFLSQSSVNLAGIVKLTAFNRKDSRELATDLLDNDNKKIIDFLTDEFSGYPILIVQGAQILNNVEGLSESTYRKKISNSRDKVISNIELSKTSLSDSTRDLLYKIALLNNQKISKKILNIVVDDPQKLEEAIYDISKYMLITNVNESSWDNPVFEMHDVIANKLQQMNDSRNRELLKDIISKIMGAMPEGVQEGHIFRNSEQIHENLEVLFRNVEKYSLDPFYSLELKTYILTDYVNTLNPYQAELIVNWYEKQRNKGSFTLSNKNNYQKYIYARCLGAVGAYYRLLKHNHTKSMKYYNEAKDLFESIDGFDEIRSNTIYQLARSQIAVGMLEEAEKNINKIVNLYDSGKVSESELGMIHLAKAFMYYTKGDFATALDEVNKDIEISLQHGLKSDDKLFTSTYMLKAESFNNLGRYEEAIIQLRQLEDMFRGVDEKHEMLARINAQLAKSMLIKGEMEQAQKHIDEVLRVYNLEDIKSIDQETMLSRNIEIAKACTICAGLLEKKEQHDKALDYIQVAEGIYGNIYQQSVKNIHAYNTLIQYGLEISKAAKDEYKIKHFIGRVKVKELE